MSDRIGASWLFAIEEFGEARYRLKMTMPSPTGEPVTFVAAIGGPEEIHETMQSWLRLTVGSLQGRVGARRRKWTATFRGGSLEGRVRWIEMDTPPTVIRVVRGSLEGGPVSSDAHYYWLDATSSQEDRCSYVAVDEPPPHVQPVEILEDEEAWR